MKSRPSIEKMYEHLVSARAIELVMARHVRHEQFSGWWHPGEGQEAAAVGACAALGNEDYLWYQGRGVAWAIAKGMEPAAILGDLLCKVTGATGGKGGGIPHWADYSIGVMGEGATLGSVFPLAGGSALASKIRKDGRVSLANFGDGTASRGTFHETLVHAAAWKLPIIYFCENNGLIVGTRLEEVCPTENIADFAAGYGIPGVSVDGQDAMAVYDATNEAAERARAGQGPTIVEAKVFRRRGHYLGDPENYRPKEEFDGYRDPLTLFAEKLDKDVANNIESAANERVQSAYQDALNAPEPDDSIIFEGLYYE